VPPVAIDFNDS